LVEFDNGGCVVEALVTYLLESGHEVDSEGSEQNLARTSSERGEVLPSSYTHSGTTSFDEIAQIYSLMIKLIKIFEHKTKRFTRDLTWPVHILLFCGASLSNPIENLRVVPRII
jgi:hypothetical protein